MNAIFYGLKRAYWGSIKRSRKWLDVRWPHLTAARFDLLYALRRHPGEVVQTKLCELLGVCRPVLTRMLKSLVELGWVTRTRATCDRRTYWIGLTAEGVKIADEAHRRLIRAGLAMRWANRALAGKYGARDKEHSFHRMEWFQDILSNVREVFRAGGWLSYPWHPDD